MDRRVLALYSTYAGHPARPDSVYRFRKRSRRPQIQPYFRDPEFASECNSELSRFPALATGLIMPNYGYHLARAKGRALRGLYRSLLRALPAVKSSRSFPLEVFSYSGEAALPEQVASIRSFLRHVGRPTLFNVVSDGTYSPSSKRLLQEIDPCVSVREAADWIPKDLPNEIYPYLRN